MKSSTINYSVVRPDESMNTYDTTPISEVFNSFEGIAWKQRRASQDRFDMKLLRDKMKRPIEFYAVYDGNGGHTVCDYLKQHFSYEIQTQLLSCDFENTTQMKKRLQRSFETMDNIINHIIEPKDVSGSTASVVLVHGTTCYMCHVGDSPIVYTRSLSSKTKTIKKTMNSCIYYSEPHDYSNKKLVMEMGETHIRDNRLFGILEPLRCFGCHDLKYINGNEKRLNNNTGTFVLTAKPTITVKRGYEAVICIASDGINEKRSIQNIDTTRSVDDLMDEGLNHPGTTDDITIIKLRI